ncbi:MAG TPA: PH domain-containing protein [Candidatus Methylomirabilis sp.]|nr:PH domain-containing protein [Candidatus Methylomirabilis sp.]
MGTRAGFFLALTYNFARGMMLRQMRYVLGPTALADHLGIQTIRIPYGTITTVKSRDTRWVIKRAGFLTYAKEVPQLIEYVAQIGTFIVDRRQKVYLYSTLSSYHHPKGLILITTTDGKTYGISPAEPDQFVAELRARCPQLGGA